MAFENLKKLAEYLSTESRDLEMVGWCDCAVGRAVKAGVLKIDCDFLEMGVVAMHLGMSLTAALDAFTASGYRSSAPAEVVAPVYSCRVPPRAVADKLNAYILANEPAEVDQAHAELGG